MNLLNKEFIFLDVDLKTQEEVFEFIAKQALDLKIIADDKKLVDGFKKRESEGTTGFEDGFAIPHARIKEANKSAIFVVRLKKGIDWKAMDGNPTQVAIALIVPDGKNNEHMSILSDVATKLMDEKFRSSIKKAKNESEILKAFDAKKEEKPKAAIKAKKGSLNILAITACVTGVAHTYMAEEKLIQEGQKMGINLRVETHGSKGIGTPFSQKEIDDADYVIFAVDINIDKSRFAGKKIYQVKVASAIKNPREVIEKAQKDNYILETNLNTEKKVTGEKTSVLQHMLAGISYMIPVIVLGGICLAFSLGIAKAIWGADAGTKGPAIAWDAAGNATEWKYPWGPLAILDMIGGAAFTLMIPILAGFIGNSIAGRAAIAPAMLGAFIGNNAANFMPMPGMELVQTPTGFIGALISGLLVGYFVQWVNTWKIPRALAAAMPIFFIPLIAGIGISVIFIYVIGGPIGFVMDKVQSAISKAYESNYGIAMGLMLGALLGAMAGFDMGGPINKIAFVTSATLVTAGIQYPMGSMAAAIPVAPISMGITTIMFKRFFTKQERSMGVAAIIMGTIGISEGAIPFAIRDPKRAIPSNVLGSLTAGAIAGAFQIQDAAAHGGPIVAILGAVPYGVQSLYYIIAVACGLVVTTLVYGFWLLADAGQRGSVKEALNSYVSVVIENKKSKLSEINDQLKIAKKNKDTALIEEFKKQKQATILKANNDIKDAKTSSKNFMIEEKKYISANKAKINSEISALKNSLKSELNTFKMNNLKNITDKKLKEQKINEYEDMKENAEVKLDAQKASYRTPYSKKFQASVA